MNCQEVLRYTEPNVARGWKRMTLHRATDAAETLDMALLLSLRDEVVPNDDDRSAFLAPMGRSLC